MDHCRAVLISHPARVGSGFNYNADNPRASRTRRRNSRCRFRGQASQSSAGSTLRTLKTRTASGVACRRSRTTSGIAPLDRPRRGLCKSEFLRLLYQSRHHLCESSSRPRPAFHSQYRTIASPRWRMAARGLELLERIRNRFEFSSTVLKSHHGSFGTISPATSSLLHLGYPREVSRIADSSTKSPFFPRSICDGNSSNLRCRLRGQVRCE